MPLPGDGRSGTLSLLPSLYSGVVQAATPDLGTTLVNVPDIVVAAASAAAGGTVTPPSLIYQASKFGALGGNGAITGNAMTCQAGDVLVVKGATEGSVNPFSGIAGGSGFSWALTVTDTSANHAAVYVWTATVPSPQNVTPVASAGSSGGRMGITQEQWRGVSALGASAKWVGASGATAPNGTSANPSISLTATQDHSVVTCCCGDYAAGRSDVYTYVTSGAGAATNEWNETDGVVGATTAGNGMSSYSWYHADAGAAGAKALGMSAPTQTWTVAALELKGTASGGGGTPIADTEADVVGASDVAPVKVQTLARSAPGVAGAADAAPLKVQAVARLAADAAGATDKIVVGKGEGAADPAGASDATRLALGRGVAASVAGAADASVRVVAAARTAADGSGATDAVRLRRAPTATDAAGATDGAVARQTVVRTTSDVAAATDSHAEGVAVAGLAVPTGLAVAAISDTLLRVTWDAVTGADGYDLERDGTVVLSGYVGTSYDDAGRTGDTAYTYRVRSVQVI